MKNLFLKTLIGSLLIAGASYAEEFTPNGSLGFTQTFYGNAGKYETESSHPSVDLSYNFAKDWNLGVKWDRVWNMYDYDSSAENQQNNNYSSPQATLTYNHGMIENSKIKWTSSLTVQNQAFFTGTNNTYLFAQTAFDFSEYIPKGQYVQATQVAISPMYIYGWSTKGPSGHVNTGILSLLTNWQLPADFTFTFNAYAFREWYNGSFELENQTTGTNYDSANYFMLLAWLGYSKELYKFNDQTSLTFNFTGGFDPYISSNRSAAWDPFIVGNQMYEWLGPAVDSGNNKNTYALFALPQLEVTYNYTDDLS
ncbi:MAG: FomA family porin-like outer membrane protein, partial [Sarcina sp.]